MSNNYNNDRLPLVKQFQQTQPNKTNITSERKNINDIFYIL